ncbi:MAG: hypothetical protein A3C30_00905 [Candidatus Levybacteria bacterium RIFCSPHIGHO2_02_FULL_40_18]|nr:MAG: hypothetical protein A2869_03030 [Candidatus Levybacteria bacterium RIFCSPHIGHO2_01_FULL_40_58]OGH27257.1 MAG: hypothetical protein A3C30_00905 [Candidatus Levybacteria bacterium RIFCSPHIGHO2_02_FULL_40_18]OGH31116.1 MAG: hypothetical protein A3E43_05315 [Candidatus Levybacteria bacterium RIFCSPHIGHO2_12_FULL_40_31]OGH40716.1 MAG: hypothetical protein A2894_03125 [Candidatus Levybacteria bacterium RIFCSPLOWO2_01_FULL_40_64]OGH49355.1 MAG: hypothetical protein A3I54_01765 [Candidatus Lev
MKIAFPFSFNIIFWILVGILRYLTTNLFVKRRKLPAGVFREMHKRVAVCLPAHNEEDVIATAIKSAKRVVPPMQIYIVSDGSTDRTAQIAKSLRCNLLINKKGLGKAKALKTLLKKFNVLRSYDYVIFVDADTKLDANYLNRALKYMYYHPETAALTAHANPYWRKKTQVSIPDFISAYRTRLYRILQMSFMYGQTWKYTNVNVVIPGFAALFRTSVLKKLRLDTPGVWIEDFNLAFQVHKKNLGTISYEPNISATYEDPNTLADYWNQVKRWNVGFYQTLRAQGIWPSFFWLSLTVFTFEFFFYSIFILTIPIALILLVLSKLNFIFVSGNSITSFLFPSGALYALEVFVILLIFDYIITIIVGLYDKKYRLILYGPFFILFQFLNSLILLSSIKKGLFGHSSGRWVPAARK